MLKLRRRRVMILISFLLILAGVAAVCVWAGYELASPPRRALQDYHREFLADPAAHGVKIEPFQTLEGTPCLLVEPLASGALGTRGQRVREQLGAKGVTLSPPGKVVGTLVLVHGRKGRKEDYLLIAERLCAAGFRCLLPDMPGHGEHPRPHVTFGLTESDIPRQALHDAAKIFHFSPVPAGLLGMSMGGAVAMRAAAAPEAEWKALVIISSFDRLEVAIEKTVSDRVGQTLGHIWRLGAGIVYRAVTGHDLTEIRSDTVAGKITMPTLIAHGTKDRVIPYESGKRLYAALPQTLAKQWVEVPGADHDNVLITDFPIYATVAEWMLREVK
jgi:pimeloyl-ACP methyl ester carboxylesterase